MFKAIKTFIQNARVNFDYPRYERELRKDHLAQAELRFDSSELNREASQIRSQATIAGEQKFSGDINPLRCQVSAIETELQKNQQLLLVFERDYKTELDDLYARKNHLLEQKNALIEESKSIKADRTEAHDDLKDAYEDLEDAKGDVGRWYSKSERNPLLFGNGGKKLPRHSIFGQSHGDLSAAKSRRGQAVGDIGSGKRRLASIKAKQAENRQDIEKNFADVGEVKELITKVKADRQRMYDLKAEGFDPTVLRNAIQSSQSSLAELKRRLQVLEDRQRALVVETQARLGLGEKEAAILALQKSKAKFIDDFDSETSQATRRDEHRKQWVAGHR